MLKIKSVVILIVSVFSLSACFHDEDEAVPVPTLASISGTITPAQISAMDTDVNDRFAPYTANDSTTTAQLLANPVILGGYLNLPGEGPVTVLRDGSTEIGASHNTGDVIDVYKVSLAADQVITLNIAEDADTNDLQLLIIDSNNTIRNQALRAQGSQSVSLTVAAADIVTTNSEYFVAVAICNDIIAGIECNTLPGNYRGYTNYTMRIGPPGIQSASLGSVDLNTDFVPGDIMVKFKQSRLPAATSPANALSALASNFGLSVRAGAVSRISLLNLGDTVAKQKTAMTRLGVSVAGPKVAARKSDPKRQLKLDTLLAIQALRKNASVEYAEPNFIRRAFLLPDDTYYGRQWHYPLINLPQAWDISTGSPATGLAPVIVAVVDTGVLLAHPDIQGQTVSGYDFISNVENAGDGDGIDADPNDVGDQFHLDGTSSFHGSHVAGTVAAKTNNGSIGGGVAGIAWGAKIMPIRVLGRLGGSSFDILEGLRYAAGLPNDSNTVPPQRADIVNLSLGGDTFSASEQQVINDIRAAGVIVVAAAGNDGVSDPSYPAAYDGVISVSAVGGSKRLAPYSNFGSSIDMAAPGGDSSLDVNRDGFRDGVFSLRGDDSNPASIVYDYGFAEGTSMAAPHVAGVLALMKAVNPALTPNDIDAKIANGDISDDLGVTGRDDSYGYGLINALKAVISASNGDIGAVLTATPNALNFGSTASVLNFTLANLGNVGVVVQDPTSDQPWLSITKGVGVTADGLGEYTATVDRSSLPFGSYSATITVTTVAANTLLLPVTMQSLDPAFASSASAGTIYLLVIDPSLDPQVESQVVAGAVPVLVNGQYQYTITDIDPGKYYLYAGNDSDYDFRICGKSESCGAYSSLTQPTLVTLTGGARNNLDFTVNFDEGVIAQSLGAAESGNVSLGIPRQLNKLRRSVYPR